MLKLLKLLKGLWRTKAGTTWGAFKILTLNVLPYLSIVGMGINFTTLYIVATPTGIGFYLLGILAIAILIGLIYIFEYWFGMPSVYKMGARQAWEADNPVRKVLEQMQSENRIRFDKLEEQVRQLQRGMKI